MPRVKMNKLEREIQNLSTAIFSNESNSVLRIPTTVIRLSSIDIPGILVFPVSKPYENIDGMDLTFPATLQFYNKRFQYCIKVFGQATVCSDFDNISCAGIMIRLMLKKIEYLRLENNHGSPFSRSLKGLRQLLVLAFQ